MWVMLSQIISLHYCNILNQAEHRLIPEKDNTCFWDIDHPQNTSSLSKCQLSGEIGSEMGHCVKSVQIRSFFWSVFSRIRTEYGEIRSISSYLVRMRENTDHKKLRIWTLFTQWELWFAPIKSLSFKVCLTNSVILTAE